MEITVTGDVAVVISSTEIRISDNATLERNFVILKIDEKPVPFEPQYDDLYALGEQLSQMQMTERENEESFRRLVYESKWRKENRFVFTTAAAMIEASKQWQSIPIPKIFPIAKLRMNSGIVFFLEKAVETSVWLIQNGGKLVVQGNRDFIRRIDPKPEPLCTEETYFAAMQFPTIE